MRNAVAYVMNNDERTLEKGVNSINSFYHFNKGLGCDLIILTDDKNLPLENLSDECPKPIVVTDMNYDYASLKVSKKRFRKYLFFKSEIFANDVFDDYDNLLLVDCDTVVADTVEELFTEHDKPTVSMVPENGNNLVDRRKNLKYGNLSCDHYCNAGVVFITPRLLGRETRHAIHRKYIGLSTSYKFKVDEQDALNAVFGLPEFSNLLKPIGKEYNFNEYTCKGMTKAKFMDVEDGFKIKHYCCNKKYEKAFLRK